MERFFERKLSHLSLRELNFYMIVAYFVGDGGIFVAFNLR